MRPISGLGRDAFMTLHMKRFAALGLSCVLSLVLVVPAVAGERPVTKPGSRPAGVHSLDVKATAADDEIPGVAVPASPIVGSLDEFTDYDDVFAINLVQGQVLRINLVGDAGTDFDTYLYPPGTTSVITGSTVAEAATSSYPEAFTYKAPASGTFYLDIYAFSGTGSYTLTYQVITYDADSELPGIVGAASPITGTLDDTTDPDDVYSVDLLAGQDIEVGITGPVGTDFDLYLFAPGSTSVNSSPWDVRANGVVYPDVFSYIVPTTGRYYLDAYAPDGAGAYTITITEAIKPVVTCMPAATYPVSASVAITAADTGGSGVKSITYQLDGAAPVTVAGSAATVVTSALGTHTLVAAATDGSGNISNSVTRNFNVTDTTTITLTKSSAAPAYGTPAMITATLRRGSTGAPIAGRWVYFELLGSSGWAGISVEKTNENGTFTRGVYPHLKAKSTYRVRYKDEADLTASTSAPVVVTPKVSLTKPNAPTTMYKGRAKLASGYLKPRHAAGSYPVKIYKYRYVSGKWKSYGFVKAKATNYSTYTKFAASVSLPYKGKWRLRAYAPADSKHAATWSAFDYVTVK